MPQVQVKEARRQNKVDQSTVPDKFLAKRGTNKWHPREGVFNGELSGMWFLHAANQENDEQ